MLKYRGFSPTMYEPIPPPPPLPTPEFAAPDTQRPRWVVPGIVLGVACLVLGLLLYGSFRTTEDVEPALTGADLERALESAFATTTPPPPLAEAVYAAAVPSLVFIETVGGGEGGFSVGSGVVVSDDGQILTALHVVDEAVEITVNFSDGSSSLAQIASAEPERDIAVLVADQNPSILVPAVLGGGVSIGDDTFALGNPLGLTGSMSAGVISGLGRALPVGEDGQVLEDLIQFDAAVNPGSSGGPLLDRNARVVGIVTALVNPDGEDSFTGIGFAVPIQAAAGGAGAPPQ